jgi:membrane fusion protein (multidrug efflux system)
LDALAALCRLTRDELTAENAGQPLWRGVSGVSIAAPLAGVVVAVMASEGAWVDAGEPLFEVVDIARLRLRAVALQGDLERLAGVSSGEILAPGGQLAEASVALAPRADAEHRLIEVLASFEAGRLVHARPGVSARLRIVLDPRAEPVLAIPLACVIRDGLDRVVFRRDPNNADKVIRVAADLGREDGYWVEVRSGIGPGDEVVQAGIYELKLTGAGKAGKAGHFHADGTWHEGSDH